jgi:hypothetical protein
MIFILLLTYSAALTFSYFFPIGLVTEWYDFYAYLDVHGAIPYIDVREGYPPLGFLIYMPLYYVFRGDRAAFFTGFRALNGALLVGTLFSLYLVSASVSGERKAWRLALSYAVLPSVVIANAYSNDVVALLPAGLALYMIVKRRAVLAGVLLGLATLGKGFPILLLIPALIAFTEGRDRLKLVAATAITLASASLPFLLTNPFTYISTFTHHGSRGPWETVWALIDGYYSHGGFLHPYFDKFFYHQNLLKMYDASPYDHAIYAWRFSFLPDLLTVGQVTLLLALSLAYLKRRGQVISLSGLLYVAYMLFFKGYSTQFSPSTQFYILLAAPSNALIFLLPMESSQIMQMLSWNAQSMAPELLRNEHLPLLVSAILLRSIVFTSLVARALWNARIRLGDLSSSIRGFLPNLRLLRDRGLVALISATVLLAAASSSMLYGYMADSTSFRSFDGRLSVTPSEWQSVRIDGLEVGDQVMVRLTTKTWIDAKVAFDGSMTEVERGVVNPYSLKGSFNETMLFFVARSDSASLMLRMKHPSIPFRVTDGLESDLDINMSRDDSALLLELHDRGMDGRASLFRIAYPYEAYVGEDFSLRLRYHIIEGNVSDVLLDVFDDADEWLYTFQAAEGFVLKPGTKDIFGYSNLRNDHISLVGIVILLGDGSSATFRLEELGIGGSKSSSVKFYAEDSEEIGYRVFVERDFKPSAQYVSALTLSVALSLVTVYYLYRRVEGRSGDEGRGRSSLA